MSGHGSKLIAQLRAFEKDESLEPEERERARERADELEAEAESDSV